MIIKNQKKKVLNIYIQHNSHMELFVINVRKILKELDINVHNVNIIYVKNVK